MIKLLPLILLLLLVLTRLADAQSDIQFKRILDNHRAQYPDMQPQDYYKLIYQATLGNEHLISDTAGTRHYLLKEIESIELTDGNAEKELFENISPDSSIFRVNLYSFKKKNGEPEKLLQAMLKTSADFKKSEKSFKKFLRYFEKIYSRTFSKNFQKENRAFLAFVRSKKFPAVHHSMIYREKYRPAYRIISKANLLNIF